MSSDSDKQAVRRTLEARFGRAVPVTEAMIDAVIAALAEDAGDET